MADILWKMGAMLSSDHSSVVPINLFVALLCACIVIGHLLEEQRWMNESITALAVVSIFICLLLCYFICGVIEVLMVS